MIWEVPQKISLSSLMGEPYTLGYFGFPKGTPFFEEPHIGVSESRRSLGPPGWRSLGSRDKGLGITYAGITFRV